MCPTRVHAFFYKTIGSLTCKLQTLKHLRGIEFTDVGINAGTNVGVIVGVNEEKIA